uniref:hypothetical protein n=1 Tax=Ningiella ruwaisensis TaxID=2364274 RepID=UPI00109F4183|nr:hypothetical protein [Ningiella ruwaisensis]
MRKIHKYISIFSVSCGIFIAGAFVGHVSTNFDLLCSSASPHVLPVDMVSENGIVFPKGTIVPVKTCAYMQRFDWEFAIDNSVKLKSVEVVADDKYGFSQLEVVQ